MADKKISALTAASTPLAGSEVLPIVQSGATVKVSVDNLTTGKVVPANGVKFPATQVTSSDPNTLDDYEEGTWTPTQGAALTVSGTFSSSGTYTKVGRLVTVVGSLVGSGGISSATGIICGNLPFEPGNTVSGSAGMSSINAGSTLYIPNTNVYAVTAMAGGGAAIIFTATFFV